jgi:hypothetical protein
MKALAISLFRIAALVMVPAHKINQFELFGLDFLVGEDFNPWLIECNSNPCL